MGGNNLVENSKALCLMNVIESKGKQQTIIANDWELNHAIRKLVNARGRIINPQVEVFKNSTLVSGNLFLEIEVINESGIDTFYSRQYPVSVVIATLGSETGMSAKVTGSIETLKTGLIALRAIRITTVIDWAVLVISEKECCCAEWKQRYFEKSGVLLLAPSGATEWEDVAFWETVTYIVYNPGPVTAPLFLEGSPNQAAVFKNTPLLELAPGTTACLAPKFFARFLRLSGKSSQKIQIKYWLQAQS
jgi:hypothetical protein